MAKYMALVSFCGAVSMAKDEVREIPDLSIAKDLISAGYIKEVKKAEPKKTVKATPEKAEPKKTTTKKKTSKKK